MKTVASLKTSLMHLGFMIEKKREESEKPWIIKNLLCQKIYYSSERKYLKRDSKELIFIYCGLFVLILVVFLFFLLFFLCCFFFHYVSAKFHLWPSSGDLPRPRIGILSLVTVSPVITAFHSCLSYHVFDQVNLWPAWVWFETAISWQCSQFFIYCGLSCVVSSFTTFRPNFTSGLLQVIYRDLGWEC